MSVFTTVTPDEMGAFLKRYAIGGLVELKGIAAGITNTNYFVTTTHGRYVLTLFETLRADELPYYVNLLAHLAQHGIAVAGPIANHDNAFVDTLNGKPTLLVNCLPGAVIDAPNAAQCREVGEMLAQMHLAAGHYDGYMANPRGRAWREAVAAEVAPFMADADAAELKTEVASLAAQDFDALPAGVIHADLFRDNALIDGERVGGFIDFYYACNDTLAYDVAITLNDWCVLENGDIDAERARALLAGYQGVRAFEPAEVVAWPQLLRAAAVRFWVSRLYDFHKPAAGEMTFAKDPGHFQRVLRQHVARTDFWL
ncbi:homoserine kinase [Jeongeupia wiesaeckerbachi]|uniref:homoserine kinase n=1 Tax=Jeongeupia wiesaeckerbachi TaxID=3051218 RepID=UPI003D8016B7